MKRHALTRLGQHALSTLSAMWVIGNLLVWLSLLIVTLPALLVLKPLGREQVLEPWIGWIYRSAVRIDSFWMLRVVGIQLEVKVRSRLTLVRSSLLTISLGLIFPLFRKSFLQEDRD